MAISLTLQRQIEQFSQDIVVQQRAERMFITPGKVVPHYGDLIEGKRYYTYPILNMQGRAAVIANNSFDVAGVDAFTEERTHKVELIYQPWNIPFPEQIESGAVGINQQGVAIELATQAIYNTLEDIGYNGLNGMGMFGIANQPNVLQYVLPADGTGSTTQWLNKTAEQILRDVMGISYFNSKSTRHAYNATHLYLPPSAWEPFRFTKTLTTSGTAETPYARFIANLGQDRSDNPINPENIKVLPGLETAGTGGTPVAIMCTPTPRNIGYLKTAGIKQRPMFENVEGIKSAQYVYAGGLLLKQPLSFTVIQGI
jgi:hypothetical protein